jgi:hypothetical protein
VKIGFLGSSPHTRTRAFYHATIKPMQTTLEKAISKLQTLPPDQQESIAAVILQELEKTATPKEHIKELEPCQKHAKIGI